MITNAGRTAVQQSLTGFFGAPVGALAIGVGTSPETVDDTTLDYEIGRAMVNVSSVDQISGAVIYKATIPEDVSGTVHEMGAWTNVSDTGDAEPLLLTFEPGSELWTAGDYTQGNSRIGEYGLTISASTQIESRLYDLALDLSSLLDMDEVSVALNADASVGMVELRLMTDDTNYIAYTMSPAVGYQIIRFLRGDMAKVGSPDMENLTTASVIVTPTAQTSLTMDGLKVSRSSERNVLVSRSVLATPVVKKAGMPLELEFRMDVS